LDDNSFRHLFDPEAETMWPKGESTTGNTSEQVPGQLDHWKKIDFFDWPKTDHFFIISGKNEKAYFYPTALGEAVQTPLCQAPRQSDSK
jgi:hypothetical protein